MSSTSTLNFVLVLAAVTLVVRLGKMLEELRVLQNVLTIFGLFFIVKLLLPTLWVILQGIRAHVVSRIWPENLCKKYGNWAVVTGSTDGIGKAYAQELAKRGINIVLVSRSLEKLQRVAAEIASQHPVQIKIVQVDFSRGQEVYEEIRKELYNIPIGILVNNVGCQYTYPMYVDEVPERELWSIMNVNIGATTMMTHMILPQMKERGRGAIVNVSSGAELQPLPLMNVYAASKVFVKNFTEALQHETKNTGVTVQHLSPFFVTTKMNAFSKRLLERSLFVPDAITYSRNAVNTLGLVPHSTGYWAHGFQYWFTCCAPHWLRTTIGGLLNEIFRNDYFQTPTKVVQ